MQIYTGEFDEFMKTYRPAKIYYKEHPLNHHYQGVEESRDWMFDVHGYFQSFFAFWKKCKRQMISW
jgi:deoxyribodipyrimidine photo-lyase